MASNLISLEDWKSAGLTYQQYENDRKRGKLVATRGTRNKPVQIEVDSIKDPAKKAKIQEYIIAKHGDPNAKSDQLDNFQTKYMAISDKDRNKAWSMYHVAKAFNDVRFEAKKDKTRNVEDATEAFLIEFRYADRWAEHRKVLANSKGEVPARKTIYKWAKDVLKKNDPYALINPRVERQTPNKFTDEQQKYIYNMYGQTTQMTVAMVHRSYNEICVLHGWEKATYSQVNKYIKFLELTDGAALDKARYGQKYAHDKHEPHIERDYSQLKFMGMLVADGKKLDYFIKVGNKKVRPMFVSWMDVATDMILGFELSLTESTVAVASSFRMAMINAARIAGQKDAGLVPSEVYTDNGKAFNNHYWDGNPDFGTYQEGVFAAFEPWGLKYRTRAKAYNGQAKTIERRHADFPDIEKRVPTHCGNSTDNRPAHYRRHELMATEQYELMLDEFGWLDLQSAYNMMEAWVEQMNNRPGNGKKLKGYSPMQLALKHLDEENTDYHTRMIPIRSLDELMMHKKVCKLERNGVRINNIPYFNRLKMGHLPKDRGIEFMVKWSPFDKQNVLVYNMDGTFVCEAEKWAGYGVAASYKQLGSEAKEHHKKAMEEIGQTTKVIDEKARQFAGLPPKRTRKKQTELPESPSMKSLPERRLTEEDRTELEAGTPLIFDDSDRRIYVIECSEHTRQVWKTTGLTVDNTSFTPADCEEYNSKLPQQLELIISQPDIHYSGCLKVTYRLSKIYA